jgi:hypothetical protein
LNPLTFDPADPRYETLFLFAEYCAWREQVRRQMHRNESHEYLERVRAVDHAFSCGWSVLRYCKKDAELQGLSRKQKGSLTERQRAELLRQFPKAVLPALFHSPPPPPKHLGLP